MDKDKKPTKQQVLFYTLERAITTYDWLEALQKENGVEYSKRKRVLCDTFSGYLTTLVDGGKNRTISLKDCCPQLFKQLKGMEVVKKCKENRNNRFAHEADTYGHFVQVEDILNSDIKEILEGLRLAITIYPQQGTR